MPHAFNGPIRRTKIVATLGPASDKPGVLDAMIRAGVDVVRLNFSHGSPEDHRMRAEAVRQAAAAQGRSVAVLGDLQGPKIRIARFKDTVVTLSEGQPFVLDIGLGRDEGTIERVGCDYQQLADDVVAGDVLLLDDGRLTLRVTVKTAYSAVCTVVQGGILSSNKGVNKFGGGLSANALTEKDKADIKTAAALNTDYLAISFVQSKQDIEETRELLKQAGSKAHIIAKIERAEAITDALLPGIIASADGVMVARGDLGVEIGDANLVAVQKQLIEAASAANKVVITATQMMESMISAPIPTRAEVFDVANAVLDGTDAVMLSAETAVGQYPIETVKAMARVIEGAEKHPLAQRSKHRINETFERIDESLALSAMYVANHLKGVKAIICMTETGFTPLLMSRITSSLPIYAMAEKLGTCEITALYKGVIPVPFDTSNLDPSAINHCAVEKLREDAELLDGDLVIITKGDFVNVHGGTNTLKIVRVGDVIR